MKRKLLMTQILELISARIDSDSDGLWAVWEMEYFGNLNQPADGDPDGDGLKNSQEFSLNIDPSKADSDGLKDGEEVNTFNTNLEGSKPLRGEGRVGTESFLSGNY
jgi:hypothetical protein